MKTKVTLILILIGFILITFIYSTKIYLKNEAQLDTTLNTKNEENERTKKDLNEDITDHKLEVHIISNFSQLLAFNASEAELLNFIYMRSSSINDKTLNELIIRYLIYQYNRIKIHDQMIQNNNIQEALLGRFDRIIKEKQLNELNDVHLRNRIQRLYVGGYILVLNDGKYHLDINLDFFSKFEHRFNQELKDFISIEENIYNPNERITINWSSIYRNILLSEDFIENYPTSKLYSRIYTKYILNIDFLLFGTDYNRIFNDSNRLKTEIQEVYKEVILNQSGGYFNEAFSKYYNELINADFYLNSSIEALRHDLIQIIKENYQKK